MTDALRIGLDLWLISLISVAAFFVIRDFDISSRNDWAGGIACAPAFATAIWLALSDMARVFAALGWGA